MREPKRKALSLRISELAVQALNLKATREGHRYPAALAASLLERALLAPPADPVPSEPETVVTLRGFARAMGASLEVGNSGFTLIMAVGTPTGAIEWTKGRLEKCPALTGSKVTVLGGLPS